MSVDFDALLASLARVRPVFHSEADFQHALAWEARCAIPGLSVRLEVPMTPPAGVIDMVVGRNDERIGVELKYGRGPLKCSHDGDSYCLPEHPLPVVRYEFWQDVARIEAWVRAGHLSSGIVICLSNHDDSWKPPSRTTTQDQIRFHDGLQQRGRLELGPRPRSGKTWAPIELCSEHLCRWKPYSVVDPSRFGTFRYLLLHIVSEQSGARTIRKGNSATLSGPTAGVSTASSAATAGEIGA